MHELVHSILHSRLFSALRIPSFAGNGLADRMRSTSFALLGLTAAAGLALVAIFAQPSFPLLSPAPLPAEPSVSESIADARELPRNGDSVALYTALPASHQEAQGQSHETGDTSGSSGSGGSSASAPSTGGSQVAPAEVDVPAPESAPESSDGNSGGGAGGGTEGGSAPAPAAAPQQPTSTPSTPPPSSTKPQPVASTPKPPPAPGSSASAAAAEHASERGIEASASSGPPTASTASVAPEDSASPGNGNGLAKGLDK
jgi:hypothetical protein